MKYIKTFESFDFNQTLPITSEDELSNFYSCDDCDFLWRSFNTKESKCVECKSPNIEELSLEEWVEMVKPKLSDSDKGELDNIIDKSSKKYIDLFDIKNKKEYVN